MPEASNRALQRALHYTARAARNLEEERVVCLKTIHNIRDIINTPENQHISEDMYKLLNKASAELKTNKEKRVEIARMNRYLKKAIRTRKQMLAPANKGNFKLEKEMT